VCLIATSGGQLHRLRHSRLGGVFIAVRGCALFAAPASTLAAPVARSCTDCATRGHRARHSQVSLYTLMKLLARWRPAAGARAAGSSAWGCSALPG
jgi:hypothetical protein